MNGQRYDFAHSPYAKAPPGPINDPTPLDQAVYVPAISAGYAIDVQNAANPIWNRMPAGLSTVDMNYLDPANQLFRISHALFSAGQAMMNTSGQLQALAPNIVTMRDRQSTRIIIDSGGYQVSKSRPWINGYRDRLAILRWMEAHGDLGMTLDIPPGPIGIEPGYQYSSLRDCLDETLDHLDYFERNRRSVDLQLLTVLHGRNAAEANTWYDECKKYPFSGWAFGGVLRQDFHELCRRILIMEREGQIQNKTWIHILGTCSLETAVVLTGLQRAINKHINPNLRISYDTASPAIVMSYGQSYTIPTLGLDRMSMPTREAPDGPEFINSSVRWPWPSPLGERLLMRDLCVRKGAGASSQYDTLSYHLLAHHNLGALCWGIAQANRIFDAEGLNGNHTIAPHVGEAVEAIHEILRVRTDSKLRSYASTLARLKYTNPPDSSDNQRDFY